MAEKELDTSAQRWADELKRYADDYKEPFINRGIKIVKRYRDDRKDSESAETRFNILWSNIRTLKPAIFAKIPKPEVSRRFKDKNPIARTASQLLERALTYEITQYTDYNSALSNVVEDMLLPGRGVAWLRYEPITEVIALEPQLTDDIEVGGEEYEQSNEVNGLAGEEEPLERITSETSPVDYVYWQDFAHDPSRTWEEVTWVARRVYLSKDEVIDRFGEEFKDVPLTNQAKDDTKTEQEKNAIAKAEVWEIWCKTSKKVYWIAKSYDKILDERDDPLELQEFFPCPKPLYATISTDSLVPVPDYALYQDQARELDEISERIRHLTRALKVVGIYAADEKSLARLLKEGKEAEMIPVTNWMAFAEKGGLKGMIEFVPLGDIVATLQELYRNREQCKQTIYEITGLSDIVRGASQAIETATAQNIKSQFASIRLSEMKNEVARFARDLIRMKAEIMCSKYQPETLVQASGMQNTPDAQYLPQAIELLKNEPLRNFTIDIEADSLVELDQQQEKQDRTEFLSAVSGYLEKAVQAAQMAPDLMPLMGEMLLFGIRGFKIGQSLEGTFETTLEQLQEEQAQKKQQPPQPSPDEVKAQADMQAAEAKFKHDAAIKQMELEHEQKMAIFEAKSNAILEEWKANLEASTKIAIANIPAQQVALDQQIIGGI